MISSENNEKMENLTLYHKLIDLCQLRIILPTRSSHSRALEMKVTRMTEFVSWRAFNVLNVTRVTRVCNMESL